MSKHLLAVIVALAIPLSLLACGGEPKSSNLSTMPGSTVPATMPPATMPTPARYAYATAVMNGQLQIYSEPDETKKLRTLTNPRLINDDPGAKVPLVVEVRTEADDWLQVVLPIRPNGTTGWVRANEFSVARTNFRIEIVLSAFRLKAFDGDREIMSAPIGVASETFPTPPGHYFLTELLAPPDASGPYGPYAYGLSGFSSVLQTFGGGPGQLGIHGTNEPEKVGTKVSHGCIRLKNEDIIRLVGLNMPLGTPVFIAA